MSQPIAASWKPHAELGHSMMAKQRFRICHAISQSDVEETAKLFTAYADSLGIDLTFQSFSAELTALPGKYAEPEGVLLLAKDLDGRAFGCVGLRPLQGDICEMKRLYITTQGRGTGAGRALAEAVISQARDIGYRAIRLDTLSSMTAALALYKNLGFHEIEAYYDTPLADTIFLELSL